MKQPLLVFSFLAAFSISLVANAAPAVDGPTGLIAVPSADTLREGQFSLGYYKLDDGGTGSFNMSLTNQLEVGVAGFHYDNRDKDYLLNAKFSIFPETVLTPGFAVGVLDATGKKERTAYAVVSKALPFGFRLHAGVGNGRYDGGFAAIEKTINPLHILTGNNVFPATTLIAEYDGRKFNYGARMSVLPGLKLDAGRRHDSTYFGISFTN